MAPKTGPSLRELMKGRNKAPSLQEASKSKPSVIPPPPPPQLLADFRLKLIPELRRKRHPKVPEEGEVGPLKGSNSRGSHRTKEVGGPTSLTAEKSFLWLKYVVQHAFGLLNWRWTVYPLPGIPSLGITVGGMQVMSPRPWSSHSSFQKTWRPIETSINRSSFCALRGIWPW